MTEPAASADATTKPSSPLGALVARLRRDGLSTFGVIGTVLTVLSTLEDTLTLGAWAHAIVGNFQDAAAGFWTAILPGLSAPPSAMDIVFLNLAAFMTAIALGSLAPWSTVPKRFRDANWRVELAAGSGVALAVVLICWAGFTAVTDELDTKAFPKFQSAIESAETKEQLEAAGEAYFTAFSAFFPLADQVARHTGLAEGDLVARATTSVGVLLAMIFLIVITPSFLVYGIGWVLGYGHDSRRMMWIVWSFLAILLFVVSLSALSQTVNEVCEAPSNPFFVTLCKTLL